MFEGKTLGGIKVSRSSGISANFPGLCRCVPQTKQWNDHTVVKFCAEFVFNRYCRGGRRKLTLTWCSSLHRLLQLEWTVSSQVPWTAVSLCSFLATWRASLLWPYSKSPAEISLQPASLTVAFWWHLEVDPMAAWVMETTVMLRRCYLLDSRLQNVLGALTKS